MSHHADSGMVAVSKREGSIKLMMKTVEKVIANMPDTKMFSILDAKCDFWPVPFRVFKTHHLHDSCGPLCLPTNALWHHHGE